MSDTVHETMPIPKTTHAGILEHFWRVADFYNMANGTKGHVGRFRMCMAAIYSCRAIAELMFEDGDKGIVSVSRDDLKAKLVAVVPFFNLVEKIRIHDFHRSGLLPPDPTVKSVAMLGPVTLTAKNGGASLAIAPDGKPIIQVTGGSTVKGQRPLYTGNGLFYDEDTGVDVRLTKIIHDYIMAIGPIVEEYEIARIAPAMFSVPATM